VDTPAKVDTPATAGFNKAYGGKRQKNRSTEEKIEIRSAGRKSTMDRALRV
jgi:hypothetical protein